MAPTRDEQRNVLRQSEDFPRGVCCCSLSFRLADPRESSRSPPSPPLTLESRPELAPSGAVRALRERKCLPVINSCLSFSLSFPHLNRSFVLSLPSSRTRRRWRRPKEFSYNRFFTSSLAFSIKFNGRRRKVLWEALDPISQSHQRQRWDVFGFRLLRVMYGTRVSSDDIQKGESKVGEGS